MFSPRIVLALLVYRETTSTLIQHAFLGCIFFKIIVVNLVLALLKLNKLKTLLVIYVDNVYFFLDEPHNSAIFIFTRGGGLQPSARAYWLVALMP